MTCPSCGREMEEGHRCRTASAPEATIVVRTRGTSGSKPLPGPGQVLGAYRLISVLGEGSVGRVYSAEHTRLGRRVAVKMIRPELSDHPKAVERFFGEARAVNQIAHENIVGITDFIDEGEFPAHYIMDHLDGQTLAERLHDQGPLDIETARSIGLQLLSALEAVHRHGIVHRDLKPANIFLVGPTVAPVVKLLDFGVAKLSGGAEGGRGPPTGISSTVETMLGDLIGTPRYMAPEQTRGLAVDARADIYAFGIILYEMLTGHTPFESEELTDVLAMHQTEAPIRPSQRPGQRRVIPEDLEGLIMDCLEKLAGDRPQTATEVKGRLGPPRPVLKAERWPLFAVAAAGLVLMIVGASWLLSSPIEAEVLALPATPGAPPSTNRDAPSTSLKAQAVQPEPIAQPAPAEPAVAATSPEEVPRAPLSPPKPQKKARRARAEPSTRSPASAAPAPQKPAPESIDTTETLNPFGASR